MIGWWWHIRNTKNKSISELNDQIEAFKITLAPQEIVYFNTTKILIASAFIKPLNV